MASEDGSADAGLSVVPTSDDGPIGGFTAPREVDAPLPGDPREYRFFQAMRLLEQRFPEAARPGGRGPASLERIRLRASTSLSFPTAEVTDIRWLNRNDPSSSRVELTAGFLGLVGALTPMPLSYAQEVLQEEEEAPQLRVFLDLFHHRLLSLLYRAWLHHRHAFSFEQGAKDALSRALLDLIGASPELSPERLGMAPQRLLAWLGPLLLPSRPVSGLEALLSTELELPVRVEQGVAHPVVLTDDQRFRLRTDRRDAGRLGQDIAVGARMVDRSGSVKLVIGPTSYARMLELRPGSPDCKRLAALTRLYVRQPLRLMLEVLVPATEVPPLRAGGCGPGRLGRTAHVGRTREDPLMVRFQVNE